MTRPRRLYTTENGKFYYLVDGKKKFVKAPTGVSEKQLAQINIRNIVNAPTRKRVKRRRKKIQPAFGAKVGNVLQKSDTGGLPLYFFKPSKQIPTLQDQAEASADTTIDKLAKSILKLLPASSRIEPTITRPRPPPPPAALPPAISGTSSSSSISGPSSSSSISGPSSAGYAAFSNLLENLIENAVNDVETFDNIWKNSSGGFDISPNRQTYATFLKRVVDNMEINGEKLDEDDRKVVFIKYKNNKDFEKSYNETFGKWVESLPTPSPTVSTRSTLSDSTVSTVMSPSPPISATPPALPPRLPAMEPPALPPRLPPPLPAKEPRVRPPPLFKKSDIITSTTKPEPVESQNLKGVVPEPRTTNNPLPITLERTYKEDPLETMIESKKDFQLPKPTAGFDEALGKAVNAASKLEEALRIGREPFRPTGTESKEDERKGESKDDQGGAGSGDGLYNDEIEKIVKKRIKNYVPVIASDEINQLPRYVGRGDKRFGFIINTNPSKSDGSGNDGYRTGHWRAVYINNEDDYPTIEYFDPLSEGKMPKELVSICRKIAMKMNPEMMFKYKQNMLQRQSNLTSNCGHHSIKFLDDRYNGVPWSEATGYTDYMERLNSPPDDSHDGEKDISKYIKKYESYI